MPSDLTFWRRFESCTVSLDFAHGLRFPGGRADKRALKFNGITDIGVDIADVSQLHVEALHFNALTVVAHDTAYLRSSLAV